MAKSIEQVWQPHIPAWKQAGIDGRAFEILADWKAGRKNLKEVHRYMEDPAMKESILRQARERGWA